MSPLPSPLDADRRFFDALLAADVQALDALLTPDFVLVEVMRGSEVSRATLIDALAGRKFHFDAIDVAAASARLYGEAAIVSGRTSMRGRAGDQTWTAVSRYVHVFVVVDGLWRLASAQGTPIADPS